MGGISDLVVALSLLGLIRAYDARQEERTSRQEEVFVPFNLSALPQQEQVIGQLACKCETDEKIPRTI